MFGRTVPGAFTGLRSKPTQFMPFGTLGPQGLKRVRCSKRPHVTVRAAVTVAAPPGLVTKPWAGTPEQVQVRALVLSLQIQYKMGNSLKRDLYCCQIVR